MRREGLEVEQAFRRVDRIALLNGVKQSRLAIGLLAAALFVIGYWTASPRDVVGVRHGLAMGCGETDPNKGPNRSYYMSVKIDTGTVVTVAMPGTALCLSGAQVNVTVLRRRWSPHLLTYRFKGYADQSPAAMSQAQ